jgi:exodeoxyribonuclease-3
LNKEPDNYTWWTMRFPSARLIIGWRIDYCLVSEPLKDKIKER